jgi:hypothetical protein
VSSDSGRPASAASDVGATKPAGPAPFAWVPLQALPPRAPVHTGTVVGDDYRRARLFTRAVNDELRRHVRVLEAVHRVFARPQALRAAPSGAVERADAPFHPAEALLDPRAWRVPLMSLDGWLALMDVSGVLDAGFTRRDAVACFMWARPLRSDDGNLRMWSEATHLNFADFLEALCRLADMKTVPTDAEIARVGRGSVVEFYMRGGGRKSAWTPLAPRRPRASSPTHTPPLLSVSPVFSSSQ